MIILGIETSCDETSAGVVELNDASNGAILRSNVVLSSMDLHAVYGGVVPEIAARSHIESIIPVVEKALAEAFPLEDRRLKIEDSETKKPNSTSHLPSSKFDPWDEIDGIAVTYGAGLGGCLLVGVMTARTLAITKNKPLYAVNHVEAHAYANFLTETVGNEQRAKSKEQRKTSLLDTYRMPHTAPSFPMLGLIVSGGHSQLVLWRDHFDYTLLGQTQDDAIGEAFDKVAKILGLPYPGGPSVSKLAKDGNPMAFNFPKAQMTSVSPALAELRSKEQRAKSDESKNEKQGSKFKVQSSNIPNPNSLLLTPNHSYDYSFSGPKTAVLRAAQKLIGESHDFPSHKLSERLSNTQKADIAASFQRLAVETVVDKTVQAYEEFQPKSVIIGGGVASSPELRKQLSDRIPIGIQYPDPKLCTDNGSMIATLGCFKMKHTQPTADPYSLEIQPNLSM